MNLKTYYQFIQNNINSSINYSSISIASIFILLMEMNIHFTDKSSGCFMHLCHVLTFVRLGTETAWVSTTGLKHHRHCQTPKRRQRRRRQSPLVSSLYLKPPLLVRNSFLNLNHHGKFQLHESHCRPWSTWGWCCFEGSFRCRGTSLIYLSSNKMLHV